MFLFEYYYFFFLVKNGLMRVGIQRLIFFLGLFCRLTVGEKTTKNIYSNNFWFILKC